MIERGALFSDNGRFRYLLWRTWQDNVQMDAGRMLHPRPRHRLAWVMCNPSIAGGEQDDPTIRKCVGFARRLGFGGITVVNLFAHCATDPKRLWKRYRTRGADIVGPEADAIMSSVFGSCDHVVLACGGAPAAYAREAMARRLESVAALAINARPKPCIYVLGRTQHGLPKHPLYVPYETELEQILIEHSMDRVRGIGTEEIVSMAPRQLTLGEN